MKSLRYLLVAALVALALPASAADFGNGSVFSQTDASNNTGTVPTWAENMAPSQVNDSARALQGALKRWFDRISCATASTGAANAYVLTHTVAPVALYAGERYCFEANFSNTATATLNVNSLGAKTIQRHVQGVLTNLSANDIYSGDHVEVTYDTSSDVFVMVSSPGTGGVEGADVDIANTTLETTVAAGDSALVYDTSAAANREMTLQTIFNVINDLTAETAPAVADLLPMYDASGSATDKITLANMFKVIDALTAETSPAVGDELALYDASGATTDKITLEDMFEVINGLTADATPNTAADYVVTYDASAGAAKKVLLEDLGGGGITLGTPVSVSGTSVNFTSLPSTVKKITVTFDGVSTDGSSSMIIQLGDSGGVETSSYVSGGANAIDDETTSTAGLIVHQVGTNGSTLYGAITIYLLSSSANTWASMGNLYDSSDATGPLFSSAGTKSLSATFDRIRITTESADTFDAGTINIQYE